MSEEKCPKCGGPVEIRTRVAKRKKNAPRSNELVEFRHHNPVDCLRRQLAVKDDRIAQLEDRSYATGLERRLAREQDETKRLRLRLTDLEQAKRALASGELESQLDAANRRADVAEEALRRVAVEPDICDDAVNVNGHCLNPCPADCYTCQAAYAYAVADYNHDHPEDKTR